MNQTTRRSLLGVTGTALLAGCGGSSDNSGDQTPDAGDESTPTDRPDRDDDGVPDGEDEFPDDPDLSRVTDEVDDTRQLEEDEWYWYQYEFSSVGEISYDFVVRDGPEIDVYLFSGRRVQCIRER